MFESLASLNIKWRLLFKIDLIALSLGCHVPVSIINIVVLSSVCFKETVTTTTKK